MPVTGVSGIPPTRNTSSNGLRKPLQDQRDLPEAYADMWRSAEGPHSRAAFYPSYLGKINVDLV